MAPAPAVAVRRSGRQSPAGLRPAHLRRRSAGARSTSRRSRRKSASATACNPHGQSVLQARRLVERGVPLVTVFWPNDGIKNVSVYWDTHSRNFIDLKDRLMPVADQAFSALLDDLARARHARRNARRLDRRVRPHAASRPAQQRRRRRADGRDHWPGCFTSVLAGGGVRGGIVYGKSDKHAAYPAADPVAPLDLVATVYHALGVPESQTMPDQNGRPVFVRPGKAIHELLA